MLDVIALKSIRFIGTISSPPLQRHCYGN